MRTIAFTITAATLFAAAPLAAQGYRLRLDTRFQSATYRGWQLDSAPVGATSVGPTGGTVAGGFAVRCAPGAAYCTFFRPGPERSSTPAMGTADLTVWGLGVPGLRLHAKARGLGDFTNRSIWPGVKPALQLLEAYAEYANRFVTVEAGRTHVTTRFGFRGFDGGRLEIRPLGRTLRVSGYGGWGLARGVDLPVSVAELNPLGDYQPTERQTVYGGQLGLSLWRFDVRGGYQREGDPTTNGTTLERAAFDGQVDLSRGVVVSGGADYDIAAGLWGSADATVSYAPAGGRGSVAVGGRRYRPYFDLWSIWAAFTPIGYSAAFGSASYAPLSGVEVRARGEVYEYDEAGATTPLVSEENDGWRWVLGARYLRVDRWVFDAAAHQEHGPGAASLGYEGTVTWAPRDPMSLTAQVARVRRPLEYRFDDSKVWTYGVRADYRVAAGDTRFYAEVRRYDETRERDDAAQVPWDQLRIYLGATVAIGSGTKGQSLHPAILRIPDVRRPQ
ncbi:MAG TPA: hypothetical protein VNL18_01525 [Gemmatimonadales bacterium]|nr:hypothetical protein [Gemmatimonadales bacterium]